MQTEAETNWIAWINLGLCLEFDTSTVKFNSKYDQGLRKLEKKFTSFDYFADRLEERKTFLETVRSQRTAR
jgi:hypothetical protein